MFEQVGITPPTPAPEPRSDADILAQDDAVCVPVPDERDDGTRHVTVRWRPATGTQQGVIEAEQVEAEDGASVGHHAQFVGPIDGGVQMAEYDALGRSAGRLQETQHGWTLVAPGVEVDGDGEPRLARGGGNGLQDAGLVEADGVGGTDLAEDPARMAVSPMPVVASLTKRAVMSAWEATATQGS